MPANDQSGLLRLNLNLSGLAIKIVVCDNRFLGDDLLDLDLGSLRVSQNLEIRPDHHPFAKLLGQASYDLSVIGQLLGVVGVNDQLRALELQSCDTYIRGELALYFSFELKKNFFYRQ